MEQRLSFSKQVKEEIASQEFEELKGKSLLSAFIRITGSIVIKSKQTYLSLKTENAKIAKFIYGLLVDYYKEDIHLDFEKKARSKKTIYYINIGKLSSFIIDDLKIDFLVDKPSRELTYNDLTISGYLAGLFLAAGSVNSPQTSNYHLELALNSEGFAKWTIKLFNRFRGYQLDPKCTKRRDKYLVYFKRSDQISNFLVMIGAVNSCMEFESVRIDRDFVNSTVRLANFDTANMTRTFKTAKRQKEEIQYIEKILGFSHFTNPKMKTLCELRLANETASLDDLAELMSEALNKKVTKSNVNHLFREMHNLYLRIKEK